MRYINSFYILIVFLFIGCSSDNSKFVIPPPPPSFYQNIDATEEVNTISFADAKDATYPSYKPSILGEGLLYQKFNELFTKLKKDRRNLFLKKVQIKVKFKNANIYKESLIHEVSIFARAHGYKFIGPNNILQQMLAENNSARVNENDFENKTTFIISFKKVHKMIKIHIFTIDSNHHKKLVESSQINLNKLEKEERNNLWTIVDVPYGNEKDDRILNRDKDYDRYKILREVVTKNGRPISNISFSEADEFCSKNYSGTVTPLYVFEYSIRNGKIKSPDGNIYREFIAPYNPELGDDIYKNKGDHVNLDKGGSTAQSQVIVYNWRTGEYEIVFNVKNSNIAFRCASKIN